MTDALKLADTPRAAEPFVPFAAPDIGEAEIAEVVDALRSGWVTTGPKTRQFESEFSARFGGRHSVSANSATAGLHLALEAIGVSPGDEVIVPTYTFTATAEVVRYLGADPVFVDVCPDTLNIDVEAVRRLTTPRTRAVIPVHFAGLACDMMPLLTYAAARAISVVDDAAHALPATYRGCQIGELDTAATVFSFYANKTMTTGEGGMVVTADDAIAARCKVMRLHGISRDAFDRYTSRTPAWFYEVVAPGFKYNLTDLASAIGIHQLRRLDAMRARRAHLAARYDEELAALPVQLPAGAPGNDVHAWHLYVIRLNSDAPITRDELIHKMADRGIGCSVHFIPLHRQPYWRDRYDLRSYAFPVADAAFASAVSIPLYSRMTDGDQDRVIDALTEILGR